MSEQITLKKQIKRSLPIGFENLVNILMTFVDTIVVSQLGTAVLGALGAMTVIINIMQMGIQTINVSNSTLVAKSIGEEDEEKEKLTTGNAMIITLMISLITIIVGCAIQPILPGLFNVDRVCNTYLTIRLIGFVQNAIVTVLSGHQRTIGNQGHILNLRIFAIILNLILDFIAIQRGYGVQGVAWVTVMIDTGLAIYLLIKSSGTVKYKFVNEHFLELLSLFRWNFVERIVSKVDQFVFNLIVAQMGPLEYAVHVILIQISELYESFVQGFGDGITISVGISTGDHKNNSFAEVKKIARKLTRIFSGVLPVIVCGISLIVMKIAVKEYDAQIIFLKVLPLLMFAVYDVVSGTYYFSILRGMRDFEFLAIRNIISSVLKILCAIILGYTALGIVGVWIAYVIYGVSQKHLSKHRYYKVENRI